MEFERLANAIAEVLDIDASKITPDSKFVEDLGADKVSPKPLPDRNGPEPHSF